MKRRWIAFALLALALVACGKKEESAAPAAIPVVTGVAVETVGLSKIEELFEAVGTVRGRHASVLSSKLLGNIVAVNGRLGDRVRKGQILAEVDARDVLAQRDKARAGVREVNEGLSETDRAMAAADQGVKGAESNLDLARATFERFKVLAERGSVSRQEYDEAEARAKGAQAEAERAREMRRSLDAKRNQLLARRDQAEADVANANAALTYAEVTSPIDGVIVEKSAEVGQLAAPGAPLFTVEGDRAFRLEADVEERLLRHIRIGDAVEARVDAVGGEAIPGRVDEIVPAADPRSRTQLVKISLEARPGLRTGAFGRALFTVGEREALLAPPAALVTRGQLVGVFALDEKNVARYRLVTTGATYAGGVEILSGLGAGERIVVSGAGRVLDGSRVE